MHFSRLLLPLSATIISSKAHKSLLGPHDLDDTVYEIRNEIYFLLQTKLTAAVDEECIFRDHMPSPVGARMFTIPAGTTANFDLFVASREESVPQEGFDDWEAVEQISFEMSAGCQVDSCAFSGIFERVTDSPYCLPPEEGKPPLCHAPDWRIGALRSPKRCDCSKTLDGYRYCIST